MSQTSDALNIGTSRQLLFDDALTQSKEGFKLTSNHPIRHDQPVLLPTKPWEQLSIWRWVTVIEDAGEYRMWYEGYDRDPAGVIRQVPRLCYAVSKDGVTWEKPNLGAIEYQGNTDNNIVFEGLGNTARPPWGGWPEAQCQADGSKQISAEGRCKCPYPNYQGCGNVFKDPHAPAEQRYKYIFTDNHYATPEESEGAGPIYGAYSADGIGWHLCKGGKPIMPWYGDTQGVCFWDDRIDKYVAYMRYDIGHCFRDGKWGYHDRDFKKELEYVETWDLDNPPRYKPDQHIRAIGRTEGEDFENLPAPVMILAPDEDDHPNMGLYHSAAVKYPYAQDAYFMFPGAFYGEWVTPPDTVDVQMATSRDGIKFNRWREPWLRLGMEGAFDCRMIDMGVGMVRRGDELLMYYGGRDEPHAQEPLRKPGSGAIGMARLRMDGFVSQDAPVTGGQLTTVPLKFTGKALVVNMDGSANGTLKVEILDANSKPLEAFSGKNAERLYGNDINRPATWKNSPDLASLHSRPVRLRFTGHGVKLYAFQFTNELP